MAEEKSIELLQAELESLKKQNLEREIALEKTRIAEAEVIKKKHEEEKLREQIRAEERNKWLDEMKDKTTVKSGEPERLERTGKMEVFKQSFSEYMNSKLISDGRTKKFTGKPYESIITDLVDKGMKW